MNCDGIENRDCNSDLQCLSADSTLSLYSWDELKLTANENGQRKYIDDDALILDLSSDVFKGSAPLAPGRLASITEPLALELAFDTALDHPCLARQIIESEAVNKNAPAGCSPDDLVSERLFEEYGAIFAASNEVTAPPDCAFDSSEEVEEFNRTLDLRPGKIGGKSVTLQAAALDALSDAEQEAKSKGLRITPADVKVASLRTYEDTVALWEKRVNPALDHWQAKERISPERAQEIRSMPIKEQIEAVLELEEDGVYFSKNLKKSILQSAAAPGASQHLVGLALDIEEHGKVQVRSILAKHGWFQTVRNDLPHFTYLGIEESKLPQHGLQLVETGQRRFWIQKPRQ